MDFNFLIILGGFIAFMYMFIIRPQQKRQREMKELMASLSPGDEVVTIGGLHARVKRVDDDTVTLTAGDAEFVYEKVAIGQRVDPDAESGDSEA